MSGDGNSRKSSEPTGDPDAASRRADLIDPAGGTRRALPAAAASAHWRPVADFDYRRSGPRAVIWAVPAVAIYRLRAAALKDLGLKDNDIITYSGTATPKLEAITPNASTPYIAAYCDLRQGPTVLEVPQAGPDGSLYGQVVDVWQFTIADVGPSGLDQGKGAKYLLTPPGYRGPVPDSYLHVASPNYRIALAFRSVRAEGKAAADAYAYAKRLRMYYLKDAANPPAQRFFDPLHIRYPTRPFMTSGISTIFTTSSASSRSSSRTS